MSQLSDLKDAILEDGIIDADEVKQLEAVLYDDGEIDQEEADMLFELSDAVSGKENDPSWNALFIKAISDFLLNDANSPGEIDKEETTWLVDKIGGDGQVDDLEKALLANLKKECKNFPIILNGLL
jgi:hypothetical protein